MNQRLILFLLGIITSGFCQSRIESVNGTSHDFGEIYQGQIVKHTFVLRNSGTDTLFIPRVQTFCGCTSSLWSSTFILPGKTKDLELTFRSSGYHGKEEKTVSIASSDPKNPVLNLTLKTNVIVDFDPNPPYFMFKNLKIGKKSKTSVTITNLTEKPVRILSAESHDPQFTVDFQPLTILPKKSVRIDGELTPKTAEVINSEVFFKTDSSRQPIVEVRLTYIAEK